MIQSLLRISARSLLPLPCLMSLGFASPAFAAPVEPAAVMENYANIGQAVFEDAHSTAKALDVAISALLANPNDETLKAARQAWIDARVPYQQSEGFRFGNPIVDEWEGRVNSWPLDEGLIDYVDQGIYGAQSDENPLFTANVIGSKTIRIGRDEIDVSVIDKNLLAETLQQAQGVEANVATGYHAVEFLLWGQDLNGTGPGAGDRPASDYSLENCTHENCDRRREYLKTATDLLVDDLGEMAAAWGPDGTARKAVLAKSPDEGFSTILTGLGSLSYGELAGERMKLGLILHDPEEEQDCFSDNTHNSHFNDQVGMIAIYQGKYKRVDGSLIEGASLAAYTAEKDAASAEALEKAMATTADKLGAIKDRADSGMEAYDQMIAEGNSEGNALVQAGVDALVAQARAIEQVVSALGLTISVEGSDSLDNPSAIE